MIRPAYDPNAGVNPQAAPFYDAYKGSIKESLSDIGAVTRGSQAMMNGFDAEGVEVSTPATDE